MNSFAVPKGPNTSNRYQRISDDRGRMLHRLLLAMSGLVALEHCKDHSRQSTSTYVLRLCKNKRNSSAYQ